jgi:hypothetical protein
VCANDAEVAEITERVKQLALTLKNGLPRELFRELAREARKQAQSLAMARHRLPETFHGREEVDHLQAERPSLLAVLEYPRGPLLPYATTAQLHTYYTGPAGWEPVVAG